MLKQGNKHKNEKLSVLDTITAVHEDYWDCSYMQDYSAAQIYPSHAYAYYTLVFCVYAYAYTRIRVLCEYARICPFVMHSYKFLYMKHCCSNKGHMGMKRLQSEICILLKCHANQWKYHISSFRSLCKFIDRFFDSCLILSF